MIKINKKKLNKYIKLYNLLLNKYILKIIELSILFLKNTLILRSNISKLILNC